MKIRMKIMTMSSMNSLNQDFSFNAKKDDVSNKMRKEINKLRKEFSKEKLYLLLGSEDLCGVKLR